MATSRLLSDDRASFTTTVIPMFMATTGLLMLSAGAILAMVPLLVLGAGCAVIGVAMYMIAASLDRADRKAAERRRSRKEQAEADFASDQPHAAPAAVRSPLADEAVAALTGDSGAGGIYPPLPSAPSPERARAGHAATAPTAMWEPGGRVETPAFGDDIVEFTEVKSVQAPASAPTPMAVTNGGGHVAPAPEWDADPERVPGDKDFRAWPGSTDVDQWATFTGERRSKQQRVSDEDIRSAMAERRKEIAGRLPTVGAILAGVDRSRDAAAQADRDMTRGKCSKCESILWAPTQRPILLKCPSCAHKAKLY